MQRGWSYLFGAVILACVGLFIAAPLFGWWLPHNVSRSTYGGPVDGLFYLILVITGFFFLLTEGLLVYFMYVYAGGEPGSREHVFGHHYAEKKVFWTSFFKQITKPVTAVIHNQHRLELFWTVVPAAILVFIALVQVQTWANMKYASSMPKPGAYTQQMIVSARQFEWRVIYPNAQLIQAWKAPPTDPHTAKPENFGWADDKDYVHVVNEIHVYKGFKVQIHLQTRDVIHSFYLPNLRLKQDALPGKDIPVWFQADEANCKYDPQARRWTDGWDMKTGEHRPSRDTVWELACAELCGWGHYKMAGRLYVHETPKDFLDWLEAAAKAQDATQPSEQ